MQLASIRFALAVLALSLTSLRAPAQDESDAAQAALQAKFEKFQKLLQPGPVTGQLGSVAKIEVPKGVSFTGKPGAVMFQDLSENLTSGQEVGMIAPDDLAWFVLFEYDASGHVKDDDKNELDADDLLEKLKEGAEEGNEERKQRGFGEMHLTGWYKPPFYDPETHNLTWSVRLKSDEGESINWSTRLLGRTGMIRVNLVAGPDTIEATVPVFNDLMKGFSYVEGQTYAEFKPGSDKVAEYGLAALVAGGAGVVAAKTGILMKFWGLVLKLWKAILIGLAAIGAFFKKLFGFGKKSDETRTTG